jgi:23S rRNA U2552 (ribose-2'-O)-methylase RlmE/FtsJ
MPIIKKYYKKIYFLQHNLILQVFKKWLIRIHLLNTIYKNKKWAAIKNYINNDLEYIKIRKEIDSFRINNIYDFDGIKMPLCVITADTFLNVLKPATQNIKYLKDDIEKFYNKQKENYKTLHYWKDSGSQKEPDYVGGHILAHGFTYFFKEIIIHKGDIVIDLGAAPGDFSAICIKNGAKEVYAFEPEENAGSKLNKVSELNQNKIEIIRKYCGEKTDHTKNMTSLDDFVKIKNIKKIDFIKADIEGAEIKVLLGAKNILKIYKPKIAFCTYHSDKDAEEIEKEIKDSNPNYIIYKEKGIIYAY